MLILNERLAIPFTHVTHTFHICRIAPSNYLLRRHTFFADMQGLVLFTCKLDQSIGIHHVHYFTRIELHIPFHHCGVFRWHIT